MVAARKRRRGRRIDDAMAARGGICTTGHEGTSAGVLVVRMILIVQVAAIDGNCVRPGQAGVARAGKRNTQGTACSAGCVVSAHPTPDRADGLRPRAE
jgi:hypothetical protein